MELFPLTAADQPWVREFIMLHWGAPEIVVHDECFLPELLPGCKAVFGGRPAGLITWNISENACEIISLDSLCPHQGIGSALLTTAENTARSAGCTSCWLVTTNDNVPAQRFYTNHGYQLHHVDQGAVDRARQLKPSIPLFNAAGVPIKDEYIFTKAL